MVEAKFILLMFIWFPSPVAQSLPVWTSENHVTLAECEAAAKAMTDRIQLANGRDVRVDHQCVTTADYVAPDDPLLQ